MKSASEEAGRAYTKPSREVFVLVWFRETWKGYPVSGALAHSHGAGCSPVSQGNVEMNTNGTLC